jgi:flagellar protein FlgJ
MAFEPDKGTPTSRYLSRSNDVQTMTQTEFMAAAVPLAQASQRNDNIPASVTLAQSILETGFGKSELAVKGKIFFGIKAHGGRGTAGTYTINTSECYNGQWVTISAAFRAYYSMAESFEDHGKFLKSNARYRSCFETNDPKEWTRRLQSNGYATDPGYSTKLISVMDKYNLYQYDLK